VACPGDNIHFETILEAGRMPTLTLKKVPARLHARLKRQAAEHRRSLNQEAIECLDKTLPPEPLDPEKFLAEIRAFRERNQKIYVTQKELNRAKRWGRL
jgi:plasmid stability protein